MAYERRCDHCSVFFPVAFLVDASEVDPMYREVCLECEAELVEELHSESTCTCACCDRARARADAIRLEAQAQQQPVSRGISPLGMELLGWTEEDLL